MANYNIGPKIGIEGEKEFRAQISRINKEYAAMESYTKAVSTAMQQQGKSQELLAAKSNSLRQQIGLQEQKYKELADALEKVRAKEGASAQEILRYEGALLDVENAVASLSKELYDTENELERMAKGLDDVGDAAEVADDKVLSFGDMLKAGIASGAILNGLERVADVVVEVGTASIEAAADVKAANAQFSQTFGDLEGRATSALRSISAETKIATTRLQGGYTALYAFTKSVGGDQETALNIAERALKAAADSAAYYDRTMEDATETLQSFLKGNYENDAALGIAATETTRNAKANELYAKSFKDLTEAQKVDTLLAMVEAGNAASGALGQAAREADSWANVTGELSEAWRQFLAMLGGPVLAGLTPVIQGITGALQELTAVSQWQTLNTSVAGFTDGVRSAETALADSNAEIAATSALAREYVSRLEELEDSGLKTADAQREYANTVELLNGLIPDLGLTIDKVTGWLDQNTGSILENIDALQAQIRAQAEQEYYADIIAKQVAVEKELTAARLRQQELQARERVLLEQGAVSYDAYTAAQLGSAGAAADLSASMSDADRELREVQTELAATNGAIAEGEATVAGYAEQLENAAGAMADAKDGAGELAEGVETAGGKLETLTGLYESAKDAARESISNQIGLFQKLSDESSMSAEEIVENWNKQRDALLNYGDNLKKAVDMGLDEALVRQLSDGTEQSMLILEELVNGTDLSVDEINAAFRDRMKADEYWADNVGRMELVLSNEFKSMVKYAEAAGLDIVDGAADGILNNISKYEQALKRLASRGQQAYRHEWSINSPSRKMMENSDYIIDGGVIEIQRRTRDMERAMAELARAGNSAYLQEQLDYAAQYPSMVAGAPGYGGTTNTTNHYSLGGATFNLYTQPGQDPKEFAQAVMVEIDAQFNRERGAF